MTHSHSHSRFSLLLLLLVALAPAELAAQPYQLQPAAAGQLHQQSVQLQLKIEGHLLMRAADGMLNRQPVVVDGQYAYQEAFQSAAEPNAKQPAAVRVVRQYQPPRVVMTVGTTRLVPQLPANRRTILMTSADGQLHITAAAGVLSRQQRDLVRFPADSALLSLLLPRDAVELQSSWAIPASSLAQLFQLDEVNATDVEARLDSVEQGMASLRLAGKLSGRVDQASSSLQLDGSLQLQLATGQVTQLTLRIKEQRAIGPAGPGLDVTAALTCQLSPLSPTNQLPLELLSTPVKEIVARAGLLLFQPARSDYRLLHSPGWHVTVDRPSLAVMRYVSDGRVLASCNISRLPSEGSKPAQLARFQADVTRTLGNSLGQLVDASEEQLDGQLQLLRVVAAGVTSDVPVQWIYYHLQDRQGRRLAISFSVAVADLEAIAGLDRTLISSASFVSPLTARSGQSQP